MIHCAARMHDAHGYGLLDTNVLIHRASLETAFLPAESAISAVTLAELSAGPHLVRHEIAVAPYNPYSELARRIEVLQRAETQYEPIPFGAEAARIFGRLTATVLSAGRQPRRRTADLMIAATAVAEGLPLFTTNPKDFNGLENELIVVNVPRPLSP